MGGDLQRRDVVKEILMRLGEAYGPFKDLRAVYCRAVGGCVPMECPMGSAGE